MNLFLRLTALLSLGIVPIVSPAGCVPQNDVRTIQRPVPATSPSTTSTPPQTNTTTDSPAKAEGCKTGSEPASAELRACCKERNWGQACDGACWQEGVGAKLKKMCLGPSASSNDCGSSPDKSKKNEWCAFHYNRRYCGISDSEWISSCKSSGSGGPTSSVSLPNDCDKSPEKSTIRDWCDFHYNRRYCGISDSEWVQTCTPSNSASTPSSASPSPAASAKATPSAAPAPTRTGTCKITQNRGFPFPRCPDRKTAKLCEEGTNGNEKGRYCVWSEN